MAKIIKKKASTKQKSVGVLSRYDWPGNVRELENFVKYMIATVKNEIISEKDLPMRYTEQDCSITSGLRNTTTSMAPADKFFVNITWDELEKQYALNLHVKCKWDISKAAKAAGMNRSTFNSRLRRMGIQK